MNTIATEHLSTPIIPALEKLDPTCRRAEILICDLALQFECLRFKSEHFRPGHFDAEKLERASGPWSTGERHCVNFILAVWSGNDWEGREFNLISAMGTLGRANVEPMKQSPLRESNPGQRFTKPLLYPAELSGQDKQGYPADNEKTK
jgi:hypothetical protein